MKHFSFGGLFLAVLSLASCNSSESQETQTFNQYGITFQHPGNWATDDAEKVDSSAVSVNCEKGGLDESGLVTIACFNDSLELSDMQRTYHEQMDSTTIYKMAGIRIAPAQPGHFGPHESLQSRFTMSLLGVPHTGWLDAFYYKGRSFMVMRQQADEDSLKNKIGFALIAKTLDVKPVK